MDRERLGQFLPFRLNRLAERLSQEVMPIYRQEFGLSRAQWRVLAHLGAEGAVTATALVTLTSLDKVKVSRAITDLEARGLISRQTDPQDRRSAQVDLTDEGRLTLTRLSPKMLAGEAGVLDRLTPAQQAQLSRALGDLEAALNISR